MFSSKLEHFAPFKRTSQRKRSISAVCTGKIWTAQGANQIAPFQRESVQQYNGHFYTIGRIIRLGELSFVIRLERRTTEDSSSRRIMRLVPVFILETNNQTNNECLPKFVQTDNASSSIKTANKVGIEVWANPLPSNETTHLIAETIPRFIRIVDPVWYSGCRHCCFLFSHLSRSYRCHLS